MLKWVAGHMSTRRDSQLRRVERLYEGSPHGVQYCAWLGKFTRHGVP